MKKAPADRFPSVTDLRNALRLALVANEVPPDDGTVKMSNAPMRPPPVRMSKPPANHAPPMPAPASRPSAIVIVIVAGLVVLSLIAVSLVLLTRRG